MKELDIRDISIIDALPVYNTNKSILNVGAGEGRLDYHLKKLGYSVISTDINPKSEFSKLDILDDRSVAEYSQIYFDTVICSEVIEHLREYKKALDNLIRLAFTRVIITVPFLHSYNDSRPDPVGHINHWADDDHTIKSPTTFEAYKDINEFKYFARPYACSIMKIRTKPIDVQMKQWDYLIIIDKRQRYEL